MNDLQTRLSTLLDHVVKPMVRHPKDVEYAITVATASVMVRMTVHAADHPLVRGRDKRNQTCIENLLGYICAQQGKAIRFNLCEPKCGRQGVVPEFDPMQSFDHAKSLRIVRSTARALFDCECEVAYHFVTHLHHDFIVAGPSGIAENELKLVLESWQPLFKAHGICIGRRLLVDIIPSKDEAQPESAAGRFAR